MPRPGHRPLSLLAAIAVALTAALPIAAPVRAATSQDAAEASMVALLNGDRTTIGLAPVQVDSRLMTIARARSNDMATKHYFSHDPPTGSLSYIDQIRAANITWYLAGEIIAYNFDTDLGSSATHGNTQWVNSSGHYAIITNASYTHVGVGVAIDPTNGRRYWTAVWVDELAGNGPAPTPTPSPKPSPTPTATPTPTPTASPPASPSPSATPSPSPSPSAGASVAPSQPKPNSRWVIEYWSRYLAPSTGGSVRYYQVQRRVDGGHWAWADTYQRTRSVRIWWANWATNELRVRMVDTRGRAGAWSRWVPYAP